MTHMTHYQKIFVKFFWQVSNIEQISAIALILEDKGLHNSN